MGMKAAIFGGSFDPVHSEHRKLLQAAIEQFGLDRAFVMPTYRAPHKSAGSAASGQDRFRMCEIAFSSMEKVEVSDFELRAGGTSYSYLTCRRFAELFPDAERYFLVGADMLENFFFWKEPDDILRNVVLIACGRGDEGVKPLHTKFRERFRTDFSELEFCGGEVSSTDLRVALAFGKSPAALDPAVLAYIRERNLYSYEAARALELEKPARREHSYRVALMACKRAKSLNISFDKALLAALLHDCGKYVPRDSGLLEGFTPPADVPDPVLHQYTGAFLAEHRFGIRDEEILDAIRYHTSGRENMGTLEKLLYLADLLEEDRSFEGVEELRALFWQDLDECLRCALARQVEYLKTTKMPLYPLTLRAAAWYNGENY